MGFHHAPELPPEAQAAFGKRLAVPAALGLLGERIEPFGDIGGSGLSLLGVLQHFRIEHPGDCRLLDDEARIAAVQAFEDRADLARSLDDFAQIAAAPPRAVSRDEDRVLQALADEILLESLLVLEVALGLASRHLVKRRLGDKEVP